MPDTNSDPEGTGALVVEYDNVPSADQVLALIKAIFGYLMRTTYQHPTVSLRVDGARVVFKEFSDEGRPIAGLQRLVRATEAIMNDLMDRIIRRGAWTGSIGAPAKEFLRFSYLKTSQAPPHGEFGFGVHDEYVTITIEAPASSSSPILALSESDARTHLATVLGGKPPQFSVERWSVAKM